MRYVRLHVVVASATWFVAGPNDGWAKPHEHQAQIRAIIDVIPEDESVSAWTTFVPALASREEVYVFPSPWNLAYYGADGVVDADPDTVDWVFIRMDSYREFDDIIDGLLESGDFVVAVDDPPFLLLRRK